MTTACVLERRDVGPRATRLNSSLLEIGGLDEFTLDTDSILGLPFGASAGDGILGLPLPPNHDIGPDVPGRCRGLGALTPMTPALPLGERIVSLFEDADSE